MAKVGFWLQGATGKLAGSKLQNGVNGTIIADNTKKPKNPKTINQILQRIFVNTVAQAYSAMQPILCHSFEGVADGVGIAGSEFVVRKKTESLTWAEWFTININANTGGGGNGDGGIDND